LKPLLSLPYLGFAHRASGILPNTGLIAINSTGKALLLWFAVPKQKNIVKLQGQPRLDAGLRKKVSLGDTG
jgi:hypothetical protein